MLSIVAFSIGFATLHDISLSHFTIPPRTVGLENTFFATNSEGSASNAR